MTLILISVAVFCVALSFFHPNPLTKSLPVLVLLVAGVHFFARHPESVAWLGVGRDAAAPLDFDWPPKLGEPYPDLTLIDQNGRRTALSEFRGKVILVEPIGLPCRACVAFAGGHRRGPFNGVAPQQDLESIETYAARYGGVELHDPRIVYVQLLLYNMQMQAPTPAEGRAWATHFGMQRSKNRIVLVGDSDLVGPASRRMIPGFQLIDKDFILRADSTGHQPKDNLYTKLLPMIKQLVAE